MASCAIVVVAFSPVLVGGKTLSSAGVGRAPGTNGYAPFPGEPGSTSSDFRIDKGASVWQTEPWAEVIHREYSTRELPLWNPYEGAGAPLAANMVSAAFDPLLLAVYLHPTPLTWDLSIIGAFVLGAAAAYVFGRVLGLRIVPAVVGSAAFSLSGWFFLYSNNPYSRSYVFLPALFLLVELTLRSRRWWWSALALGITLASNIYVGMPEASFFVIGSASIYAAVRLVQERRTTPMPHSLFRLGGAAVLGLSLAAPLLLSFSEYEALSFNVHKPDDLRGAEAEPALGVLHLIAPWFPGAPALPRNWYGAAVVVSALAALSGRQETKRLHAWLFLAFGGFVVVKSYDFRVLEWVGHLPVARLVVFPAFSSPIASFAFAMLAGIGVHVLASGDLRTRRFLTLVGGVSLMLVGVLIAGDRLRVIVEERQTVWLRAAFFATVAIAAALVATRLGRRWAANVLALTIVLELVWLAPFTVYAQRADPYLAPGWMPFVRAAQGAEPYSRVLGVDGKLYPNTAAALGLYDIRALDALFVARYWRYVKSFVMPEVFDRFTGDVGPLPRFRKNAMFDVLGVRAVLSKRNLATVPAFRYIGRDRDTRVYENLGAYPRAWVVHNVHVVDDEDEAFGFLRRMRVDRTARSSWSRSTRGAKPWSSTATSPRTQPCTHSSPDRTTALSEAPTARPSSATRETLCLFASRRLAAGCSFSRTPTSRAGMRR